MIELLKEKIKESRKTNLTNLNMYGANDIATNLYKTLLGEIELEASRKNRELKIEECYSIIKKFLKSNEDFAENIKNSDRTMLKASLYEEKLLLEALLPKTLSKKEIGEILTKHCLDAIIACDNLGKAMGIAMKTLKSLNLQVNGKDVDEVVNEMIN